MPNFTDPFPGSDGKNLSKTNIISSLRLNLAAEEDAAHTYVSQSEKVNNSNIRKILLDIADEERVHAGEFLRLIEDLDPEETRLIEKGRREVEDKVNLKRKELLPGISKVTGFYSNQQKRITL